MDLSSILADEPTELVRAEKDVVSHGENDVSRVTLEFLCE